MFSDGSRGSGLSPLPGQVIGRAGADAQPLFAPRGQSAPYRAANVGRGSVFNKADAEADFSRPSVVPGFQRAVTDSAAAAAAAGPSDFDEGTDAHGFRRAVTEGPAYHFVSVEGNLSPSDTHFDSSSPFVSPSSQQETRVAAAAASLRARGDQRPRVPLLPAAEADEPVSVIQVQPRNPTPEVQPRSSKSSEITGRSSMSAPTESHIHRMPAAVRPLIHGGVLLSSGLHCLLFSSSEVPGLLAAAVAAYSVASLSLLLLALGRARSPGSRWQLPPLVLASLHVALVLLGRELLVAQGLPEGASWWGVSLQLAMLQCSGMLLWPGCGWLVATQAAAGSLMARMVACSHFTAADALGNLLLPCLLACATSQWPGASRWLRASLSDAIAVRGQADAAELMAEVLAELLPAAAGGRTPLIQRIAAARAKLEDKRLAPQQKELLLRLMGQLGKEMKLGTASSSSMPDLHGASPQMRDFVRGLHSSHNSSPEPEFRVVDLSSHCSKGHQPAQVGELEAEAVPFREQVQRLVEVMTYIQAPAAIVEDLDTSQITKVLGMWKVDMIALSSSVGNRALSVMGEAAFRRCMEPLHLQSKSMKGFLSSLEVRYRSSNPYHNATHAADVLNSMAYFLSLKKCLQIFRPLEQLAAFVAAAGHDVGHDGRSNRFHALAGTPIAQLFNDQSPLENLHCTITFACLRSKEDCNLLPHLPAADGVLFRNLVVHMILETDLSKHMKSLNLFQKDFLEESPNLETPLHRQQLLSFLLKASDVGGSAKPFAVHAQWTTRINAEFFRQGDEEKALKLSLSPFCDRLSCNVAESQGGFFNFIVSPLFAALNKYLESRRVGEEILTQVSSNAEFWRNYIHSDFDYDEPESNVEALVASYQLYQQMQARSVMVGRSSTARVVGNTSWGEAEMSMGRSSSLGASSVFLGASGQLS